MQDALLALFPLMQGAPSHSSALSHTISCSNDVLREKIEVLRPFSKVDEVEDHTYHLGEVAFGSLTYGEDTLEISSYSSTYSITLSL